MGKLGHGGGPAGMSRLIRVCVLLVCYVFRPSKKHVVGVEKFDLGFLVSMTRRGSPWLVLQDCSPWEIAFKWQHRW